MNKTIKLLIGPI